MRIVLSCETSQPAFQSLKIGDVYRAQNGAVMMKIGWHARDCYEYSVDLATGHITMAEQVKEVLPNACIVL
jgi:hypothetical protein